MAYNSDNGSSGQPRTRDTIFCWSRIRERESGMRKSQRGGTSRNPERTQVQTPFGNFATNYRQIKKNEKKFKPIYAIYVMYEHMHLLRSIKNFCEGSSIFLVLNSHLFPLHWLIKSLSHSSIKYVITLQFSIVISH